MKRRFFILLLCTVGCMLLYTRVSAQEEVPLPDIEQQFENLAEADESETQADSYWQQMQAFRRRPLDINAAT
ncbi:MAG TPA: hypothetical protein PKD90_11180, partial [Phnomibacter sp.]|nr:hypothetical protein [Phnomibacter sp.]